jgi:hypothetical protein
MLLAHHGRMGGGAYSQRCRRWGRGEEVMAVVAVLTRLAACLSGHSGSRISTRAACAGMLRTRHAYCWRSDSVEV